MANQNTPEQDANQLAGLLAEYAYQKKPETPQEQRMIADATSWQKIIPYMPPREAIPALRAQAQKYHPLSPAISSYMELIATKLEMPPPYPGH